MFCCAISTLFCLARFGVQFLYPAKESLKNMDEQKNQKQWLSYWVIYFLILIVEKLTFDVLTW